MNNFLCNSPKFSENEALFDMIINAIATHKIFKGFHQDLGLSFSWIL